MPSSLAATDSVPLATGQCELQDFALRPQPRRAEIERHRSVRGGRQFQVRRIDHAPFGHDHRPLHAVLQLAHIAWPRMGGNRGVGGFGEAADAAAELPIESGQEVVGQQQRVAAAVAQRWNAHGDGVHAVEQIGAERALVDPFLEARVGGGHDAHIDLDPLPPADALDHLVLQEAQQLHLQRVRQVADLVEEQRAVIGTLDLADRLLHRAGECAALMAEQLGLPAGSPGSRRN